MTIDMRQTRNLIKHIPVDGYMTGLIDDPMFYAGQGETDDLNPKILQGLYQSIVNVHGYEAARNYVKMVDVLANEENDLNAGTFIASLYELGKTWKYNASVITHVDDIAKLGHYKQGCYDPLSGQTALIMTAAAFPHRMGSTTRGNAQRKKIIGDFLDNHRDAFLEKVPEETVPMIMQEQLAPTG